MEIMLDGVGGMLGITTKIGRGRASSFLPHSELHDAKNSRRASDTSLLSTILLPSSMFQQRCFVLLFIVTLDT